MLLSVAFDYDQIKDIRMDAAKRQTDAALIESTLGNRPLAEQAVYEMNEAGEAVKVDTPAPPPPTWTRPVWLTPNASAWTCS